MGKIAMLAVHGTRSVVSGSNWARDRGYGKGGIFAEGLPSALRLMSGLIFSSGREAVRVLGVVLMTPGP